MRRTTGTAAAAGLTAAAAVVFAGSACARGAAPAGPAPAGAPAASPLAVMDSVLSTSPLDRTHWGIAVIERSTGRTVAARNADRHFVPASSQKLLVAAVALAELGPAWQYETPVLVEAAPGDSVASALILSARGDPTWSARFFPDDVAALDTIVHAVAAAGIRRIAGDIVIDATRFDDARVHGTWEVGDLPFAFAPPVDALAIAEATFRVVLEPGEAPGSPARVVPADPVDWQPVTAALRTGAAVSRAQRSIDVLGRRDTVRITGTVLPGTRDTLRLAVTEPAASAARALRARLEAGGIPVGGGVRIVRDSAEAAALATARATPLREVGRVRSPPVTDIVAALLRPSQNWIAEQLVRTLGAERRGAGTWPDGIDVVRRYLIDRAGIDSLSFVLRDASGLSVQNLLTPETIVRLLEHARGQPWGEAFREALPAAGMAGSTLEGRLPELGDRLRAKTGTVTHVNSLSGYLVGNDGQEMTFSIMTNASGRSAAAVRRGMDRIIRALANGGDPR